MKNCEMSIDEAKQIVAEGKPQKPMANGHPEDFRDDYDSWKERMEKYNKALRMITA